MGNNQDTVAETWTESLHEFHPMECALVVGWWALAHRGSLISAGAGVDWLVRVLSTV